MKQTQTKWSDEIKVTAVRSMRGGRHFESNPFVATIEVRDEAGKWNKLLVENHGTGGSDMIQRPYDKNGAPGHMWKGVMELVHRIEALHKAQVADDPSDQFASVAHGFEVILGSLLDDHAQAKVIEKKLKTHVVGRNARGLVTWSIVPSQANVERIRRENPDVEILNVEFASDAAAQDAAQARTMKWVAAQIRKGCIVVKQATGRYMAYRGPVTEALAARVLLRNPGGTIVNDAVAVRS